MQEQLIGEYNTRSVAVRVAFLAAILLAAALASVIANVQALRAAVHRHQAEIAAHAAAAQLLGGEPAPGQPHRQKKGMSSAQRRNRKSKPMSTTCFDKVTASTLQQPLVRPFCKHNQEQLEEPAKALADSEFARTCEVQCDGFNPHSETSDGTLADSPVSDVKDGDNSQDDSLTDSGGVVELALEDDCRQMFHVENSSEAHELPLALKDSKCGNEIEGHSFTDTSVGSDIGWFPGDEEQSSGAENEYATSWRESDLSTDEGVNDASKLAVLEGPRVPVLIIPEPFCESNEIKIGSARQPNDCTCDCGWGCMAHQSFSIHLLLAHRHLSAIAAQGPPGFEGQRALATERLFQTAPRERTQSCGCKQSGRQQASSHRCGQ